MLELRSCAWDPELNRFRDGLTFSTADISIQLLMDTMNALQEIESRVTARAFAAVMDPTKGPEVREVLDQLLAVLDETSSDGVI